MIEALALIRQWWKAGAGFILAALIIFPLGQCSGERKADARHAAEMKALAEKAKLLEANARSVADAAAKVRETERQQTMKDLQDAANNASEGRAVASVLERLRSDQD